MFMKINNDCQQVIEIPSLGLTKKVKSIQIYRKSVLKCQAGDRAAVCVTQFEPTLLERGIVCTPGLLSPAMAAITTVHKVKHYKSQILSKAKYHITIGHETVIGRLTIFAGPGDVDESYFSFDREYLYRTSMYDPYRPQADEIIAEQYALIEFEKPLLIVPESLFIASKLDMDIHSNSCRIAFYGQVSETFTNKNYVQTVLPKLKIFKNKIKTGLADRVVNNYELICKGVFKRETRLDLFTGLKVKLSTGETGIIDGCFGQTGKIRVSIPQGLAPDTIGKIGMKKSKKSNGDNKSFVKETVTVEMAFKQYIFDVNKKIVQS